MNKFENVKWEVVEHSWSDTSIYDQDGNVICTKSIYDEATEETQDQLESEVSDNFNLIAAAPDLLKELIHLEDYITRSLTLSGCDNKSIDYILRNARPLIEKLTT